MTTVTFDRTRIVATFQLLETRALAAVVRAVDHATPVLVNSIRANVASEGTRGGNPRYRRVRLPWLRKRKTWPRSRGKGLTSAQVDYIRNHRPIIDTQRGITSIAALRRVLAGASIRVTISSPLKYFREHHVGVPGRKHARPWAYVTDEDADLVRQSIIRELGS